MKLDDKYDVFVGQIVEVDVTEQKVSLASLNLKDYVIKKYSVSSTDTTISAISAEATKDGLHLRVWFPGTMGTMDFRTDRLNVHIEGEGEEDEETLRITRINLG